MNPHPQPVPRYATLDEWIAAEAIPFSLDSPEQANVAIDRLVASMGESVEMLGLGEPMHGGDEFLLLRNRLFQRLVEAHGFCAIAMESSFLRGCLVNEYIAGNGPTSYAEVQDPGFSHGFGRLEANRELVEWMRQYNADASHPINLRFYGFDAPTEMTSAASPRLAIEFALDYLADFDPAASRAYRDRVAPLLGSDSDWENPAAMMADNLPYLATRERDRGKVLVFAHNSHLKYGQARWQLGANDLSWWPAGAHLKARYGSRFAVMGAGLGKSDENGIGQAEGGSLEARLMALSGPALFVPTLRGTCRIADSFWQSEERHLLSALTTEHRGLRLASVPGHGSIQPRCTTVAGAGKRSGSQDPAVNSTMIGIPRSAAGAVWYNNSARSFGSRPFGSFARGHNACT